jgi:hypothetical protein
MCDRPRAEPWDGITWEDLMEAERRVEADEAQGEAECCPDCGAPIVDGFYTCASDEARNTGRCRGR